MNQPNQPGDSAHAPTVDDLDPELANPDVLYNKYKDMSYKELAARMVELKQEASVADTTCKLLNAELDVIRLRVVPERFERDDMTSIRITGIGRLGITNDAYCNTLPGHKPDLIAWMKAHDEYKLLVKEDINPSTLKSLVKDMAAEAANVEGEVDLAAEFDDSVEKPKTEFEQISQFVKYTPFLRASVTKG